MASTGTQAQPMTYRRCAPVEGGSRHAVALASGRGGSRRCLPEAASRRRLAGWTRVNADPHTQQGRHRRAAISLETLRADVPLGMLGEEEESNRGSRPVFRRRGVWPCKRRRSHNEGSGRQAREDGVRSRTSPSASRRWCSSRLDSDNLWQRPACCREPSAVRFDPALHGGVPRPTRWNGAALPTDQPGTAPTSAAAIRRRSRAAETARS